MKMTLTVRNLPNSVDVKALFEERISRLEKHLKRFKDDLTFLHGVLEKNPHKDEFFASISLYLPSIVLHCREKGRDYSGAMSEAILDIVRQLEKHKAKINREKRRSLR